MHLVAQQRFALRKNEKRTIVSIESKKNAVGVLFYIFFERYKACKIKKAF